MIIRSKVPCMVAKVEIKPGIGKYDLDHKDPLVASQLKVLRDEKKIMFDEILALDIEEKANKKIEEGKAALAELEVDKKKLEKKSEVKADVRDGDRKIEASIWNRSADPGGGEVSDKAKDASPKSSKVAK